eukprot:gene4658-20939_t
MDGVVHQGSNNVYESLEEEEDDESEDSESDNAVPLTGKSSITSQVSSTQSGIRVKSGSKKKKPTKKKRSRILANLAATKFSIVRKVCSDLGMKVIDTDSPDCMLIWSDSPVTVDRIVDLKLFQKINHFPGMCEISRKDTLARNMSKMQKDCPDEFNFVPQTWNFPGEYTAFQSYLRDLKKRKKHKTFIIKPANGAMGNGIKLTRSADKLLPHSHENIIVQEYIEKVPWAVAYPWLQQLDFTCTGSYRSLISPASCRCQWQQPLLMDNFKFDLRIYVLVLSCDPLKLFIYDDGLVRMSTVEYSAPTDANITCQFMHLTNYSVNKYSDAFVKTSTEDQGSKRTLKFFFEWLKEQDKNPDLVWSSIQDVVVKTLLVAEPHVYRAYHVSRPSDPGGSESVCFEILGFDILIDKKLKPWVLEVNRAPSFGTDQPLDYAIKRNMLRDAFKLVNIRLSDRRRGIAQEKREARKRLLRPVKRSESSSKEDRRKQIIEQKRSELKVRLAELRRDAAKEDYENRHMGNFIRIYPSNDNVKNTRYKKLAEAAAKVFTGRPYLQKEAARQFHSLKEEEVIELLEQAEDDDERLLLNDLDEISVKPPKPLMSMPSAKPPARSESVSDLQSKPQVKRPYSSTSDRIRCGQIHALAKHKGISKSMSSLSLEAQKQEDQSSANCFCGDANELTRESLHALNNMKIKFPGKSNEEASRLLDSIMENWKYHKPKVASYWLVKLDSVKRKKVIDIVKGNVRAIIQRIWRVPDVDSLRLCRMFNKIMNRLLANHGQGLWNCFNTNGDSWESVINKGTESVTTQANASYQQPIFRRPAVLWPKV